MNTATESQQSQSSHEKSADSHLECNICFEDSTEPVTTTCGHIYCWSCIYKWLKSQADHNYCPVCNNVISEEKIIPLYTKNNTHDQRKKEENIPKRPQPEREERKENDPNRPPNNGWFNFTGNSFFNTFFAGININSPNMRINIGFPTLIPTLIIIVFQFLSGFLSMGEYETENTYQNQRNTYTGSRANANAGSRSGYTGGSNTYSARSQAAATGDDDYSIYKFLFMFLVCMGLPMLIRRIMRN